MLINLGLPLVAGGLYLLKLMDLGYISMIAQVSDITQCVLTRIDQRKSIK